MPTYGSVIVMPCQIRMGRAALEWSIQTLADQAGVSERTVRRLETYTGRPNVTVMTYERIVRCLEDHGLHFIAAGENGLGAGVRLRSPALTC